MLRTPFLEIVGPDGVDLVARLRDELVGVRITDYAMGEIDELIIRFRRREPYRLPPASGTEFTARIGWSESGALVAGTFRYERTLYSGDPESGQEMALVCRSADVAEAMKPVDTEHFDAETGHTTYGDVFRTIAQRSGLGIAIDAAISKLPLPGGYHLRWRQSLIGMATEIGEDLGAIVKPQAGKLTVRRSGSFASPSGGALREIRVPFDPSYAFQVDLEPRFGFAEVSSAWFDGGKGRPSDAIKAVGRGFARLGLPHLAPSEAFATAASAAAATRLEAQSATAFFEMLGDPNAVAGAPVRPQGFGPDIDGIAAWEARTVVHDLDPAGAGWKTSVEAELVYQERTR